MQGEEGHDEALLRAANRRQFQEIAHAKTRQDQTDPDTTTSETAADRGQSRARTHSHFVGEAPQEQVQKAVPLRLRAPLPPSRPGFEARTAAFNSRRERERENKRGGRRDETAW